MLPHGSDALVVAGCRERRVAARLAEQMAQIQDAGADVVDRRAGVELAPGEVGLHPVPRARHHLHDAARVGAGDHRVVEPGLLPRDRGGQRRRHAVAARDRGDVRGRTRPDEAYGAAWGTRVVAGAGCDAPAGAGEPVGSFSTVPARRTPFSRARSSMRWRSPDAGGAAIAEACRRGARCSRPSAAAPPTWRDARRVPQRPGRLRARRPPPRRRDGMVVPPTMWASGDRPLAAANERSSCCSIAASCQSVSPGATCGGRPPGRRREQRDHQAQQGQISRIPTGLPCRGRLNRPRQGYVALQFSVAKRLAELSSSAWSIQ